MLELSIQTSFLMCSSAHRTADLALQGQIFRAPLVFYFSDNSFIILYSVFLSCIPIEVIVVPIKDLMDIRLLNL